MKVAEAVKKSYGPDYDESVAYLTALAENSLYLKAELKPLPWHEVEGNRPRVGGAVYRLHQAVVDALAPTLPLRAVFGGNRGQ